MNGILLVLNLGLGDGVIMNAVIRDLAATHELVCVPAKHHNVPSMAFMLRDLENVVIRPVEDHDDMLFFAKEVWKGKVLWTGISGLGWTDKNWDQVFYRQAGLGFQKRWDDWKCERDKESEIGLNHEHPYIFLHDDPSRGLAINQVAHPTSAASVIVRSDSQRSRTIFQWWNIIEHAVEVHCICSCFALFADSIPNIPGQKLFLYAYVRGVEPLPSFKRDWVILK